MQRGELLDGVWEFIGQEVYLQRRDEWVDKDDYVKGMTWQFRLGFAFDGMEQGTIIESSPNREKSSEMEYIYNPAKQSLKVDIEIQDVYELTPSQYGTPENPVIRLSILTGDFPAPYMRYILRKI